MRLLLPLLGMLCMLIAPFSHSLDLSQYQGKVVYLDFWASWCGPCRASFPWLNRMQRRYGSRGFAVVAVNLDQEPKLAAGFLKEFPANFSVEYDPKGDVASEYGVDAMPTSFLLDKTGKIIAKHRGFHQTNTGVYESEIKNLLLRK